MFTIFHLWILLGIAAGLLYGIRIGWQIGFDYFGTLGGVVGTVVGAAIGLVCGKFIGAIPLEALTRITLHQLGKKSTEELRVLVQRGEYVNFATFVLRSRGEDVNSEFNRILVMLGANEHHQRCNGWAAMLMAFPDVAEKILEYRPDVPADEAKIYIERAREWRMKQSNSPECG